MACAFKKFTSVIGAIAIHFHSSLTFVGKAGSLPLEWSPISGSTLVGSNLAMQILDQDGTE